MTLDAVVEAGQHPPIPHAKRVYIEPSWKLHATYQALVENPPEGYEFVTHERQLDDRAVRLSAGMGFVLSTWHQMQKRGVPVNLIKSYLDKFRPAPEGVDLTWAVAHLVFRDEPWILDMPAELPAMLSGHEWHFQRYRRIVGRRLASPSCRKIVTSLDIGRDAIARTFASETIARKTEVVHAAAPAKNFTKAPPRAGCRLLFVNSVNRSGQFDLKGGKEMLEAFVALRQRYPGVELVMRSDVPPGIAGRYRGVSGLTLLQDDLPWERLEAEFLAADIFVLPAHITPYAVFLDAMSYELPVVTTNVWGNSEIVDDGSTGLLVPKSTVAADFLPDVPWARTRDFVKVVRQVDPAMVEALVRAIGRLIEAPGLRRQLGRAARYEVEHGKFSIRRRKEALKRVLDAAATPA